MRLRAALPLGLRPRPALQSEPHMVVDLLRNDERLVGPAQFLARERDLVRAERLAVNAPRVRLVRAAVPDDRAGDDEAGTLALPLRLPKRGLDRAGVHPVNRPGDVPAVSAEARRDVLPERRVRVPLYGNAVVVVEIDQFAEPERSGERGRLRRDALHQVAVRRDPVDVVVDDLVPGAVEAPRQHPLGDGHAHPVREPLPQRAGGDLHARSEAVLRMAGRLASPLTELADVVEREGVAGEMQQGIEKHRGVPGGENEAVPVWP